jgi:hypothetical protein
MAGLAEMAIIGVLSPDVAFAQAAQVSQVYVDLWATAKGLQLHVLGMIKLPIVDSFTTVVEPAFVRQKTKSLPHCRCCCWSGTPY